MQSWVCLEDTYAGLLRQTNYQIHDSQLLSVNERVVMSEDEDRRDIVGLFFTLNNVCTNGL